MFYYKFTAEQYIQFKEYICDGCTLKDTRHGLACNECAHRTRKEIEFKNKEKK